mgnify:CR=1 FL=1
MCDDYWGYTCLHLAANRGYADIILLLLHNGASFYRKSKVFVCIHVYTSKYVCMVCVLSIYISVYVYIYICFVYKDA